MDLGELGLLSSVKLPASISQLEMRFYGIVMKIQDQTRYFDHFHLIKRNSTFLGSCFQIGFIGDGKSEILQFYVSSIVIIYR